MPIKINIERRVPIPYKKFIHEVLEVPENFAHLYSVKNIIKPKLIFTDINQLLKRELVFRFPIPIFLSLVVGSTFEIRVMETSVVNKDRCSVSCIIKINTLIGEIKLLETAIYRNYNDYTFVKIELTSLSNNLKIILQHIGEQWRIDHENFLDRLTSKTH